jgi:ATP-dependent DNA ligase
LERKRRLREIVPPAPSSLLYVDHVVGTGVDLFEAVCRNDPEGIVAKRADGPIHAGGAEDECRKVAVDGQTRSTTPSRSGKWY